MQRRHDGNPCGLIAKYVLDRRFVLSMWAMDRMWAFDAATGLLDCEAGVLLADILETFVPRGWFPPVVPGTKLLTAGKKRHHRFVIAGGS